MVEMVLDGLLLALFKIERKNLELVIFLALYLLRVVRAVSLDE